MILRRLSSHTTPYALRTSSTKCSSPAFRRAVYRTTAGRAFLLAASRGNDLVVNAMLEPDFLAITANARGPAHTAAAASPSPGVRSNELQRKRQPLKRA